MKPIIRKKGDYRLTEAEKNYTYASKKPESIRMLWKKFVTSRNRALERMWSRGEIIYGYSENGD